MIELLFVACLSGTPSVCEDKSMQFVDVTVMACTMGAQPLLARWVQDHPGWQVRRWSCRVRSGEVAA